MSSVTCAPVLVGNEVVLTGTFKDIDQALADPTQVWFKYSPAGSESEVNVLYDGVDPRVTRSSIGVYLGIVTPTSAGDWTLGFQGKGNNTNVNAEVKIRIKAATLTVL